jgi:hypothetical protein
MGIVEARTALRPATPVPVLGKPAKLSENVRNARIAQPSRRQHKDNSA